MEKYNYEGEKFLSKLYNDIHMKQSVIHSSSASDKKYEKIRKYLDREERVHEKALERGKLDLLKKSYYDKYIIKEIPKEYIDFLDKNAFDQTGHHLTETEIEEHKRVIIEDQKKSLSSWIDYLTSEDAKFYPWWAKYWAFQGMLKIGAYDNENEIYGKRDNKTVAPFVELNREALAKSIDLVMNQVKGDVIEEELKALVSSGSFTKLYTVLLKKQKQVQYDNKDIDGKWIKYDQGDDYKSLYDSLQGYNTGWCTAGEETCKSQLKNGDFYVYYTKDKNGDYKVPRLAIRMDGQTTIGEIRGVDKGQNVESHLEDVIEKKLEHFKDKDNYKKRINDSKMLTYIYTKYEHKKELTKEDLRFIYQIDRKIEGFGYQEDPRLTEIKENRNKRQDLAKIFDCQEEEIGLNIGELKKGKRLKVYYGNLSLYSLDISDDDILELPETVVGKLDLSRIKSTEGLKLPETVRGKLDLSSIKSAEGLKLPETVRGKLDLSSLKRAEGLKLPEEVEVLDLRSLKRAEGLEIPETVESLNLSSLESAEGLKLPEEVKYLFLSGLKRAEGLKLPEEGYYLELNSLKRAEGLKLPEKVKYLFLDSLESAEGLKLPEEVYYLELSSLKSAKDLKLPEIVEGNLGLGGLKSAKDLKLPETVGGDLDLHSLESAEGLKLPKIVGRYLNLSGLKNAKDLILPETVGGELDLNSLESAEGLKLPKTVGYCIDLSSLKSANGETVGIVYEPHECKKLLEELGALDLKSPKSAKGLNLPETVGGKLNLANLETAEGETVGKVFGPEELENKIKALSEITNKNGEKIYSDLSDMSGYEIDRLYEIYFDFDEVNSEDSNQSKTR